MIRTIAVLCCLLMTVLAMTPAGSVIAPNSPGHVVNGPDTDAPAGSAPAAMRPPAAPHLAITLVAETVRPRAGSTVTLALATRPEPGWHGYWGENPGDAGFPPREEWTLPKGARVGAWQWPVPQPLLIAGLMNYVYEAPYAPLIDLAVPAGLAPGTRLPVRVALRYLVCTRSLCVPEAQTVATVLTVGDGGGVDHRVDAWRRAIPKPLGSTARYAVTDGRVRIAVPYPAGARLGEAYFFPSTRGALTYAAPQRVTRDGDRLLIETKGQPRGPIAGVLSIGGGRGLRVTAAPGAVPGVTRGVGAALAAFALAVLGGLILNVMPCVFPILSLKALSLARAGVSERHARAEGLAYTAGVVLVCVGLGAAILLLRAGGAAAGWGFQLQDPRMIAVLLALSVAIAANLSGLWEVPSFSFARGGDGRAGAFATGVLAAFVATPCTGPFMAAALGAALVLPWPAALAVFAGLGLGLALPFLLIGFIPALRRRLPKPGAWMERVRRVLAVPMWLTAAALGWLLWRLAEVGLVQVLLFAFVLAGLLRGLGQQQRRLLPGRHAVAAVALLWVALIVGFASPRPAVARTGDDLPFSEARLAQLRREGRPVFAYFTADWCLTCKVNERVAIAPARDALQRRGVTVLVGDWTDGDPALGRFIEAHDRAGVPLYLYYAPGQDARVLPQVLTPGLLTAL